MSDKKIHVELTEDDARNLLTLIGGSPVKRDHSEAADAIRAALPPEYVRGGLYRVQCHGDDPLIEPPVGFWDGDAFLLPTATTPHTRAGYARVQRESVRRVEPLRVLADDEIAVKRGRSDSTANYHAVARNARSGGFDLAAAVVARYADALDAEARP